MTKTVIILGMDSVNENRRYFASSFVIGWAHTQNDACKIKPRTKICKFILWYIYTHLIIYHV